MKKILLLFVFFLTQTWVAQTPKDTITRRSNIIYKQTSNQVQFQAENPALIQIMGAPKANFSHLWEFGDGSYSKEPTPKKVYKKKGEYKVNLSVTNNYDNGKPPKTRPKTVAINDVSDLNFDEIKMANDTTALAIFADREPMPEQEMVVVLSYKNQLDYSANGKIYLFYNDKEFKNNNFELIETRTHFGETEVFEDGFACTDENNNYYQNIASAVNITFPKNFEADDQNLDLELLNSKSKFRNVKIFEYNSMDAATTRNMFFSFKTTPEMLKDTSATVKMRSVFVPDRNYKNHKSKTLEMEIVTSHDPNKMSSNATLMNYRLVRFKKINFKTRFQNNGEGPARMIRLETDTPDMFDKKTLQIVDSYPKCPICPKGEVVNYSCLDTIIKPKQIHFTFKNIYIPGSEQKNVKEKDSTKGFVKYTMKFAKDFHKQTTRSKTAIIFDKNEPVITNYATTRFTPGISIGARTGYNLFPDQKGAKSYFVGATLSPYKSYRWYWQAEVSADKFKMDGGENGEISKDPVDLAEPYLLPSGELAQKAFKLSDNNFKFDNNLLDIVPISIRYNVNNFIGVGIGPQLSTSFSNTTETTTNDKYYEAVYNMPGRPEVGPELDGIRASNTETTSTKPFKEIKTSFFADITLGFARIGPSVGARYYKSFEKNFDYWQFYAIWKF